MSDDKITISERIANIGKILNGNSDRQPSDKSWPEHYDDRGWNDIHTDQELTTIEEALEKKK